MAETTKNGVHQGSGARRSGIKQLLAFGGRWRRFTVLGCVLSGVNALCSVAMLTCVWFVLRDLVAQAPNWSAATGATRYGVWAMGFAIAGLAIYFTALMCTHVAAFHTATNMRTAALKHLARVPLGYFCRRSTGELRRVIEGSTGMTENILAHRFPDFVGSLVTPVAYLVVMVVFDWALGLLCLIPVAVSLFCMFWMLGGGGGDENENMFTFAKNYQDALDRMNKAAVEYVRGIPVVKVFQQTVASFTTFRESIEDYRKFASAYVRSCTKMQVIQVVAINATFAVLVPAGVIMARAAGDYRAFLSDFLFYVIFSALTTMMMTKMMYASQALTEAQDAAVRIQTILDAPVMEEANADGALLPADASIDFDHVCFTYPGTQQQALCDLTLHIPSGSTVALVGASGGGKTTAASLVPRFWDPDGGCARVGGIDVRRVLTETLMEHVAFVFQNEYLYHQSLLDNIRTARPSATRAQVEKAAHAAQCDDIIAKLPRGLDTVLGTKGTYLSGGEKQRVALARAILKDAPIIVLDEATAFADPENEALIQKALVRLTKGKTVLMIAHRLSTVVGADKICVLDAGRIVEQGTHAKLVSAGGMYARMWDDYQTAIMWSLGERGGRHE